ncbi:MAG: hypothetical protein QOF89_3691 [Acidobacteriota bacterium]|jgi:hypothetical protein|nr:hypothetical protein [Acidobacteriota bacterium]
MSRRNLEALLAYLAENAGRFSIDALRAQMVKAGHRPDAVERALRVYQGTEPPPDPPAWPGAVMVAIVDLVLVGLFAWLFTHAHKQSGCVILSLLPVLCLLQFVVGLTLLASTDGRRRLGTALFFGVLLFFGVSLAIVSVWGATKLGGLTGS